MFGNGFGVGLTVGELCPPGAMTADGADLLPAGVEARPSRLGELLPVTWRSDAELAAELQRVQQAEAQLAAYKAELVMGLAAHRPAEEDRQPGEPGAAAESWRASSWTWETVAGDVSEFFCDELALVLNCSRAAATTLFEHSATLLGRLRATWAALADGLLDWPRARKIAVELGWAAAETDPRIVAEVESAVLPLAPGLSVKALESLVRRELLARDAAAADRRRREREEQADVTVRPAGDGMAEFRAFLPVPRAEALRETVDTLARMTKADGDPRRLGQLRVAVLEDLVLRPWETGRDAVTAHLAVVAPLGSLLPSAERIPGRQPVAEVNGRPITAAQLRELLASLDAVCPGGLRAPAGGDLTVALVDPGTGALRAAVDRRELERLAARGCPDHPEPGCGCAVLDRPPEAGRYRPTPAQQRFVRTRDRTCRHPGCASRSGWADLDHVVPHADGGATDCDNLCCLCRRHHRLKTHARGWAFHLDGDGTLRVTTPSGVTRVTRPPGVDPPEEPAAPETPAAPVGRNDLPPF